MAEQNLIRPLGGPQVLTCGDSQAAFNWIPARIFSGAIDGLPIVIGAPRGGVDVNVAPVETERLRLQHVYDVSVKNSDAADLRNLKHKIMLSITHLNAS